MKVENPRKAMDQTIIHYLCINQPITYMAIPGLARSPEAKTGLQVTPYAVYTGYHSAAGQILLFLIEIYFQKYIKKT